MSVKRKRAYEAPERADGHRVLVDRLWPRGLRKEDARIDEWRKEVAPSDALRRWFGHDPARFAEFRKRYEDELRTGEAAEAVDALRARTAKETVTLVFAAKDEDHNNAVVLSALIERGSKGGARPGSRKSTRSTKRSESRPAKKISRTKRDE